MSLIIVTEDNVDEIVGVKELVVVYFTAKTCAPCQAFAPTLAKMADEMPDVVFAKVDIQESPEIAADFNVRSVPTYLILRQEMAIFMQAGLLSETALLDLIEQAREVDLAAVRASLN